jgi:small subunit ribosomal protein S12
VRFTDNHQQATVLFPGEGHHVREHDDVLVHGGRSIPDMPGVKWEIIRGKLDAPGVANRKSSRSKYGTRR